MHCGHPERCRVSWPPAFAPCPGTRIVSVVRGYGGGVPHARCCPAWTVRCPRPSLWWVRGGAVRRRTGWPWARRPIAALAASCRVVLRVGVVSGFCRRWAAPREVWAGVHRDDRDDAGPVGHGGQAGAEPCGGHAGDQLPEPFPPAVFLAGLPGGEVEVLDGDDLRAARPGPVQEPGQGVADLRVAVVGGAGEVVGEAAGVAVGVEVPGGEVVGVRVDPDHPLRQRRGQEARAGAGG